MNSSPASRIVGPLALIALAVSATACQDLNAFVTGEKFLRAPEESPRVEVELQVVVEESFYGLLEPVGDREELEAAMAQTVLAMADVGMRFYPILSADYASDDARPPHLMVVQVRDLALAIDHETIEEEGHAPRFEAALEGVACSVTAGVQRRRKGAPPLVIGIGNGAGQVRIAKGESSFGGQTAYAVRHEAEGQQSLQVQRQDILDALEKGVVDAFRELMPPIDREFAPVPDDEL